MKKAIMSVLVVYSIFISCTGSGTVQDIEDIALKVKTDYKSLSKSLSVENDYTYIVKSAIDDCEVYYHLDRAEALEEGVYKIPFDVVNTANGDNTASSLIFEPEENTTGVLLSFDDGYQSWVDNTSIFDAYENAKCTFFISAYYLAARKTIAAFLNSRGHEIGNHTLNHKSLPGLSREEFEYQTLYPLELMRNDGLHVVSFAYPSGLYEDWMHEELGKNYKFVRGYDRFFHVLTTEEISGGGIYIPSKSIDYNKYNSSTAFRSDIKDMFLVIKFIGDGFVAPLTTHTISTTDTGWAIRPDDLDYLFKTGTEMKVRFYRYKDFENTDD
ncbi:MAG: polysaccharide deacetylase family protein [Treponematales bacterium]